MLFCEQAAAQKMSVSDFRDAKVKCGHAALSLHSPTHLVHDKFNRCLTAAVGIGSAPLSAKQSLLTTASRIAKQRSKRTPTLSHLKTRMTQVINLMFLLSKSRMAQVVTRFDLVLKEMYTDLQFSSWALVSKSLASPTFVVPST